MTNAQTAAKIAHDQYFNPNHPWMARCDSLLIEPGEELKEDNSTLPGGAYLIAAKRYSEHPQDRHLWLLLCVWNGGYVTWRLNDGTNGELPGCYLRRDFDNLQSAVKHFNA
jgi:hypothetical protein